MVTQSPWPMPCFSAVTGLISTVALLRISRSESIMRCSVWNEVGRRAPVTKSSGYSSVHSGRERLEKRGSS